MHNRIRDLSLFSPNETLDDISTKNLVYLTLPYVLAEVENRVRTTERSDRMDTLTRVIVCSLSFSLCKSDTHITDIELLSDIRASVRSLLYHPGRRKGVICNESIYPRRSVKTKRSESESIQKDERD